MFLSVSVPRGSLDDELAVVCEEIAAEPSPVYLPKLFLKIGLETIRRIERQEHLMVEPRVGIDLALAARGGALAQSRPIVTLADVAAAVPAAISGSAPAGPAAPLAESAALHAPNSARFLQREISDCDFSNLIKKMHAACGPGARITPEHIQQALLASGDFEELESLCRWVMNNETLPNFRIHEVVAEYVQAYKDGIALELQARSRRAAH